MKTTSFILTLLLSSTVHAGVDGNGTGPRPSMDVFNVGGALPVTDTFSSGAGTGGGGGGARPSADIFSSGSNVGPRPKFMVESDRIPLAPQDIDFKNIPQFTIDTEALKTIALKNGLVKFQYKSPNVKSITIESVSTSDIDPIYMDALIESLNQKKWLKINN